MLFVSSVSIQRPTYIYIYIGAWLGLFSCEDLELFIKILELLIKFPGLFLKILELFIKFLGLFINYSFRFKLFIEFLGLSKRSNS